MLYDDGTTEEEQLAEGEGRAEWVDLKWEAASAVVKEELESKQRQAKLTQEALERAEMLAGSEQNFTIDIEDVYVTEKAVHLGRSLNEMHTEGLLPDVEPLHRRDNYGEVVRLDVIESASEHCRPVKHFSVL